MSQEVGKSANVLLPGPRCGRLTAPPSKSHAHRLLIANFLAGERSQLNDAPDDSADVRATRRCLRALAEPTESPTLDCGESGSTLRFLAPVAAALGKRPEFVRAGRLAERPFKPYPTLASGRHELAGDVSSQFVTGLLFALPILAGDSEIRFISPLESRGYVDLTLSVVRRAGVTVVETANGFDIPGGQAFRPQPATVEGDWSGAAFWIAMNALGSDVAVTGLDEGSAQPDRLIATLAEDLPTELDVSQFPDIFPEIAVLAAARPTVTTLTNIRRLRLKECDRVAAMTEVLRRFGAEVRTDEMSFVVRGLSTPFASGAFETRHDHRIAMAVAVGATRADGPVAIDDADCADKSYPGFFDLFVRLRK